MGCPSDGCDGYELAASLNFDGDGDVDANDQGGAGRGRVVGGLGVVEQAHPHLAAVVEIKKHPMVALAEIDGLQNEDVHRIFDHPPGVYRRQGKIGNNRVSRVRRINFPISGAPQLFILADGAEGQPPKRGRLGPRRVDDDARYPCLRGGYLGELGALIGSGSG